MKIVCVCVLDKEGKTTWINVCVAQMKIQIV